jgi:hypothetical protein
MKQNPTGNIYENKTDPSLRVIVGGRVRGDSFQVFSTKSGTLNVWKIDRLFISSYRLIAEGE